MDPEIIPPGAPDPITDPVVVSGTLILRGRGYETLASPSAIDQKRLIIDAARKVVAVTDQDSFDIAQGRLKSLANLRNAVEKSRTEVKAPVLELGRRIDQVAKDFSAEIVTEEARLSGLVREFVIEQQRREREAREAAERERRRIEQEEHERKMAAFRAEQEAERQRMAAERAQHEAEMQRLRAQQSSDAAAQRAAEERAAAAHRAQEEARQRAEQAQRDAEAAAAEAKRQAEAAAAAVTVSAPVAGVNEEVDYEVTDAAAFYAGFPQFCEITVKRAPLLAALKKSLAAKGKLPTVPGLRVFTNVKVRGR